MTGAMGAGKSTILSSLKNKGILCVDEPARQIISEQRNIDGEGIYDRNAELFAQLMLSRSINHYNLQDDKETNIIFDRGIPDLIAYAEGFKINNRVFINAAKAYRYNKIVFVLKGWKEIYTTDDERKMDFDSAEKFGIGVSQIYEELGYELIDVPFDSISNRTSFITEIINQNKSNNIE